MPTTNAVTVGEQGEVFGNFTAKCDKDGLWTGTQSFCFSLDDFPASIPAKGSPHPFMPWMFLDEVSIKGAEGCKIEGTGRYEGALFTNDPNDPDSTDPVYTLEMTISEEPLETHIRYAGTGVAPFPMGNTSPAASLEENNDHIVEVVQAANNPELDENDEIIHPKGYTDGTWNQRKIDLYENIRAGFTNYREPRATWSCQWIGTTPPVDLNNVGNIDAPDGPVPTASVGRNWMLIGLRSVQRGGGALYENEQTWELSGRTGWDIKHYDPTQF